MYSPISEPLKIKNSQHLTGHYDFDESINGFNPGELILVTGKVGSLSHLLMLNLELKLSEERDVLVLEHAISEKRFRDNVSKYLASYSPEVLPANHLSLYFEADVFFIEEIEKTVESFTRKCINPVIFISRLQRLFLSKELTQISREEEIKRIIFNMKRIAVKYKVPVIIESGIVSNDDTNAIPAWLEDINCFAEASNVLDKKIFTHWSGYYVKGSSKSPTTGNEIMQVNISIGSRNKHGNINLEFDYQKHKIYFEGV